MIGTVTSPKGLPSTKALRARSMAMPGSSPVAMPAAMTAPMLAPPSQSTGVPDSYNAR